MSTAVPAGMSTAMPGMSMPPIGTTTLLGSDGPAFKSNVWVVVGLVMLCCCLCVGIGIWYWYSSSARRPKVTRDVGECAPGDTTQFDYVLRQKAGSSWVCPPGYEDTGCSWDDGQDLGSYQCRRPRKVPCAPGDQTKFKYMRRQPAGSGWACPGGYIDTGCSWNDGPQLGELQCRQPK